MRKRRRSYDDPEGGVAPSQGKPSTPSQRLHLFAPIKRARQLSPSARSNSGSGAIVHRFYAGQKGLGARHMSYISRESAVVDRENGVYYQHLPEYAISADDYHELRANLTTWASAREDEESSCRGNKSHYRVLLSFDRDVQTPLARQMAAEYLRQNFPDSPSVAFIHRDTEHVHIHIYIDARRTDGRKIQIDRDGLYQLNRNWAMQYGREIAPDLARRHLEKLARARQRRIELARGARGVAERQRPGKGDLDRIRDDKSNRRYGIKTENNAGRGERDSPERGRTAGQRESRAATADRTANDAVRSIDRAIGQVQRTESAARAALHTATTVDHRRVPGRDNDRDAREEY